MYYYLLQLATYYVEVPNHVYHAGGAVASIHKTEAFHNLIKETHIAGYCMVAIFKIRAFTVI